MHSESGKRKLVVTHFVEHSEDSALLEIFSSMHSVLRSVLKNQVHLPHI